MYITPGEPCGLQQTVKKAEQGNHFFSCCEPTARGGQDEKEGVECPGSLKLRQPVQKA